MGRREVSSRRNRRTECRTAASMEQVGVQEPTQPHCKFPDDLHLRLMVMTAQERTPHYRADNREILGLRVALR